MKKDQDKIVGYCPSVGKDEDKIVGYCTSVTGPEENNNNAVTYAKQSTIRRNSKEIKDWKCLYKMYFLSRLRFGLFNSFIN